MHADTRSTYCLRGGIRKAKRTSAGRSAQSICHCLPERLAGLQTQQRS